MTAEQSARSSTLQRPKPFVLFALFTSSRQVVASPDALIAAYRQEQKPPGPEAGPVLA